MEAAYKTSDQSDSQNNEAQFLSFKLYGHDYGIPILKVQEIKGWSKVTPLPNTPPYIRGVLNLRGTIVPVIDMRLRFNMAEATYDSFTVIIVVNVADRLAGIVVDAVSDVINIASEQWCAAPDFEGQLDRQFISGLCQVDGSLLILLDVDKLVNPEMLAAVADVPQPAT